MPILNDTQLDQVVLPNSHYGYSATRLEDLGATEYTIATIVADISGSTSFFVRDMEAAIARIVQACKFSPRADNLLLRLIAFDHLLSELHGFKLLENCHLADYGGCLSPGGSTALYDATENAVASTTSYAQKLAAGDFSANAIVFVITDGMDNASGTTAKRVNDAFSSGFGSVSARPPNTHAAVTTAAPRIAATARRMGAVGVAHVRAPAGGAGSDRASPSSTLASPMSRRRRTGSL